MKRLRVVSIGILAVLALSGCAPVATEPSAAPSPSLTPTPTSAVPVAPQSTLPLACAELFTVDEASELVHEDLAVAIDETLARNEFEIAARQAGMLSCVWGGEDRTDGGWGQRLEVRILPDADAAFDVGVWQVDDGAIVYPAGSTTSEYLCSPVSESFGGCFANVLVDGYWARASVQNGGLSVGFTTAIAEEAMRVIVDRLTDEISSAGPSRPAWEPPRDALRGAICGDEVAAPAEIVSYPEWVAVDRVVMPSCSVTAPSGQVYDLSVVPGGGWALPSMVARLEHPDGLVGLPSRLEIEGVPSAWAASGENYIATLDIGSSAVTVRSSVASREAGLTYDEFVADLAGLVPQILAAG